ncbi:DUF4350 domain-containing protein [Azomonas macrocytogenes]|uniref:DUF4350 domain-containing protein n=1 Tax=Azomonas macrocytogenes TaxID=69962 RepID=A0A839T8V3_AZOMA|nr:DUF4350 domain-containing protein [Azomonas macrocytogenes]MBB3104073.1 hypothetical protein [Azomonas macrocytogenes]
MKRRPILLGGLGCLLLVVAAFLLKNPLQPYEESIDHGPAPAVRANPYLAAELFLREHGLDLRRDRDLPDLDTLPAPGHSLLLLGERSQMTPPQAKHLLDWTARGGHLLFVAERLWDEENANSGDLLLDALHLQQFESDSPQRAKLTYFHTQNSGKPARLAFNSAYHLYDPEHRAHAWANSDTATHLLQLHYGQGQITVLTDAWIWQNQRIGQYDHAWLLWYLTRDTKVVLIERNRQPGMATLLLEYFPHALSAALLLLILIVWRSSRRQGPLLAPADPARRQLREHLVASAGFLLRHAGKRRLLHDLQERIRRRARLRQPGFERLAQAEQLEALARLSSLPVATVTAAMYLPAQRRRIGTSAFIRQVADLQNLGNSL